MRLFSPGLKATKIYADAPPLRLAAKRKCCIVLNTHLIFQLVVFCPAGKAAAVVLIGM